MLKVTGLPDGITESDLNQIFSGYEILKYEEQTEKDGSISYIVELQENEKTARQQLDRSEQIIRGKSYYIRVDEFRGKPTKPTDPPPPTPTPIQSEDKKPKE